MKTSEKTRSAAMDRYYWLKEHGICTRCGRENARPGRTTCELCADMIYIRYSENHAKAQKKYRDEHREEILEKQRRRKKDRAAQGLCTMCGKKLTDTRYRMCLECRLYARRKYREYHSTRMWRETGFCMLCGNPDVVPEKKLCAACLGKARERAANARMYVDRRAHPWKKLNDALFRKKDMEHEEDKETSA